MIVLDEQFHRRRRYGRAGILPSQNVGTIMFISLLLIAPGCGQSDPPPQATGLKANADEAVPVVMATAEPLYQLAKIVADEDIIVERAIPDDALSRIWSPTAAQIRRLQTARLILMNGAGYEPWKDRVTLSRSRILDTASGYYEQFLRIPDAVVHQHGPDGQHTHPGTVWATWLDSELLSSQLRQLESSFSKLKPSSEQSFSDRADELHVQISQLDQKTEKLAAETLEKKFTVLADGPYYNYLTRRLGWELIYLHWPTDSDELSEADRSEFEKAKSDKAFDLFLLQDIRNESIQKFVESSGMQCVRIDVCERIRDDSQPLLDRLNGNIERLSNAID